MVATTARLRRPMMTANIVIVTQLNPLDSLPFTEAAMTTRRISLHVVTLLRRRAAYFHALSSPHNIDGTE